VSDARASEREVGHVDLLQHLHRLTEVTMSSSVTGEPQREGSRIIAREFSLTSFTKLVRGLRALEVVEDGGASRTNNPQGPATVDDRVDGQRDDVADVEVRHEVVDDPWMCTARARGRGRNRKRKARDGRSNWRSRRRLTGTCRDWPCQRRSRSRRIGGRRRRSRADGKPSLNNTELIRVGGRVVDELLLHERGGNTDLAVLERVAVIATVPHWEGTVPARRTGSDR